MPIGTTQTIFFNPADPTEFASSIGYKGGDLAAVIIPGVCLAIIWLVFLGSLLYVWRAKALETGGCDCCLNVCDLCCSASAKPGKQSSSQMAPHGSTELEAVELAGVEANPAAPVLNPNLYPPVTQQPTASVDDGKPPPPYSSSTSPYNQAAFPYYNSDAPSYPPNASDNPGLESVA